MKKKRHIERKRMLRARDIWAGSGRGGGRVLMAIFSAR
jgi:hypothetical protein